MQITHYNGKKVFLTAQDPQVIEKQRFLAAYAETGKLSFAVRESGIHLRTLTEWKRNDSAFTKELKTLQELHEERLFDELDDIHETVPNPALAKLAADNIKWRLSKLNRQRFGDEIRQTNTFDLTDRFARALDRLHAAKSDSVADTAQTIDVTPNKSMNTIGYDADTSDNKSDTVRNADTVANNDE